MIDTELMNQIETTRATHEFLTFLIVKEAKGDNVWKCGVVQNSNNRFITYYDLAKVRNEKQRQTFLEYADRWWWESGMAIPIDCYIGQDFDIFQDALAIIPRKTLAMDPIGPVYSITEHYLKRVKKRKVDLVNRKKLPTT